MSRAAGRPVRRPQVLTSRLAVLLVALVLCVASIPAVTATQSIGAPASGEPVAQVSTPSSETAENSTETAPTDVRHRDPARVREGGNMAGLESHLSGLLADRLGDSIVELEQGEYDRARSLVSREYDGILSRYVSVTRERRGERETRFEQAGRTQQTFVDSVADYQETKEEYDEAKQSGDEARARELARDLNEIADRSSTNRDRLVEDYTALESDTGLDFTSELTRVDALSADIEAEQEQIRAAEFFSTALTLTSSSPEGSFAEPITVRGRLVSETVASEPFGVASFTVAGQSHTTQVADDGTFAFAYRPTAVPVGPQTLDVAFVPRNDSVYLGSNTTMDATIRQTTPTVTIDTSPPRTAFGTEYRVAGRLAVGDVPVTGANVTLWIGGTALNTTETDGNGAVQFTGILPVSVPSGERTVRLGLPDEGRALAAAAAVEPVTVETTETNLDVNGDLEALESVRVSGTLVTATGDLVTRQPVEIRFDGTAVGTVVTSQSGAFDTVLWIPPRPSNARSLEIVAVFDGSQTNLASARATDTLEVATRQSTAGEESLGLQSSFAGVFGIDADTLGDGPLGGLLAVALAAPLWSGGLALVGLLVVGLLAWRRHEQREDAAADSRAGDESDDDAAASAASELDSAAAAETLPSLLIDLARDRLASAQTTEAVEYSYLAARLLFVQTHGVSKHGTHREFLRTATTTASIPESERARLYELTTRYERAVFGPTDPTDDETTYAIDLAASLLS